MIPRDGNKSSVPVLQPRTAQNLALTDAAVNSTAIGSTTRVARLCPQADCYVAVGVNAVASTSTGFLLPAKTVEYIQVLQGERVSTVKAAGVAAGFFLNVVECEM